MTNSTKTPIKKHKTHRTYHSLENTFFEFLQFRALLRGHQLCQAVYRFVKYSWEVANSIALTAESKLFLNLRRQLALILNRCPSISAGKMKLVEKFKEISQFWKVAKLSQNSEKNIPLPAFLQKIAKNKRKSKTLKQKKRKYSFLTARAQIGSVISSGVIPYQFHLYYRSKQSSFLCSGKRGENWKDLKNYWKPHNGWNCLDSSWSETSEGFGWS